MLPRHSWFAFRLLGCGTLALSFLLAYADSADAQRRPPKELPKETPLRSTSDMLKIFREVVAKPSESVARIKCDGKDVALGAIVAEDGWILTKFSQLDGRISVVIRDGGEFEAKLVGVHDPHDLAMLKIETKGLKPLTWSESKVAPVGNWVASPGQDADPVAIGVVSVAARDVSTKGFIRNPSSAGYLGVGLQPEGPGVKVSQVMPKSAAEKAGIKVNDVILSVNGKNVEDQESLLNLLQRFKPDETVKVAIKRDGKEETLEVTLGKRPPDRGDFQNNMGSELSKRRLGFPRILQHDSVVKPTDCGGPLVDLDGNVLGINIARAGRTESYAVPGEAIKPLLPDLMSGKLAPPSTTSDTSKLDAARAAVKAVETEKDQIERDLNQAKTAIEQAKKAQEAAEKRLNDVLKKLDAAKTALEKAESEAAKPNPPK